jgi:hypothetical protein
MDNMNITSAQYVSDMDDSNSNIKATIENQELYVPLDPANRHYAEIMRQVSNGTLDILPANAGESGTP